MGTARCAQSENSGVDSATPAPSTTTAGVGMAATPEMASAVDSYLSLVMDALAPWSSRERYINLVERPDEDVSAMFAPEHYERLRRLKASSTPPTS